MPQSPHHPLERTDDTVDTVDRGAKSTVIERLVVALIIGLLIAGAALAVGRIDAVTNGAVHGDSHDVATDHDPAATGAATPEGNTRP